MLRARFTCTTRQLFVNSASGCRPGGRGNLPNTRTRASKPARINEPMATHSHPLKGELLRIFEGEAVVITTKLYITM
jgi:hypothetical protein